MPYNIILLTIIIVIRFIVGRRLLTRRAIVFAYMCTFYYYSRGYFIIIFFFLFHWLELYPFPPSEKIYVYTYICYVYTPDVIRSRRCIWSETLSATCPLLFRPPPLQPRSRDNVEKRVLMDLFSGATKHVFSSHLVSGFIVAYTHVYYIYLHTYISKCIR